MNDGKALLKFSTPHTKLERILCEYVLGLSIEKNQLWDKSMPTIIFVCESSDQNLLKTKVVTDSLFSVLSERFSVMSDDSVVVISEANLSDTGFRITASGTLHQSAPPESSVLLSSSSASSSSRDSAESPPWVEKKTVVSVPEKIVGTSSDVLDDKRADAEVLEEMVKAAEGGRKHPLLFHQTKSQARKFGPFLKYLPKEIAHAALKRISARRKLRKFVKQVCSYYEDISAMSSKVEKEAKSILSYTETCYFTPKERHFVKRQLEFFVKERDVVDKLSNAYERLQSGLKMEDRCEWPEFPVCDLCVSNGEGEPKKLSEMTVCTTDGCKFRTCFECALKIQLVNNPFLGKHRPCPMCRGKLADHRDMDDGMDALYIPAIAGHDGNALDIFQIESSQVDEVLVSDTETDVEEEEEPLSEEF